jgi:hypothetical protein
MCVAEVEELDADIEVVIGRSAEALQYCNRNESSLRETKAHRDVLHLTLGASCRAVGSHTTIRHHTPQHTVQTPPHLNSNVSNGWKLRSP